MENINSGFKYNKLLHNTEYVSKDIMDEDFLKAFLPYHTLQIFLGICRVDAKNRFVTESTHFQRIYSSLCLVVIAISQYYFVDVYFIQRYMLNPTLATLGIVGILSQFLLCLLTILTVRFFNRDANVELYIKLQNIDRNLFKNRNIVNKTIYNRNLVEVFIFLIIIVTSSINIEIKLDMFTVCRAITATSSFSFYIELVFFRNLIYFVCIRTRFVYEVLKNHKTKYVEDTNNALGLFARYLSLNRDRIKTIVRNNQEMHIIKIDTVKVLKEILDVYCHIQKLFSVQVCEFFFVKYNTCLHYHKFIYKYIFRYASLLQFMCFWYFL